MVTQFRMREHTLTLLRMLANSLVILFRKLDLYVSLFHMREFDVAGAGLLVRRLPAKSYPHPRPAASGISWNPGRSS